MVRRRRDFWFFSGKCGLTRRSVRTARGDMGQEGCLGRPSPGALTETWIPTRKRNLTGVVASAAAMSQPSGGAVPALIPDTAKSIGEHAKLAQPANPFSILSERVTPDRTRGISARVATRPAELTAHWPMALAWLIHASGRLEPQRAAWRALLPVGSPSRGVNFPLIHLLARALMYEDDSFLHDLMAGMPIAGEVPATGVPVPRLRVATNTADRRRAGMPARNRTIAPRVRDAQGTELPDECRRKKAGDIREGWVSEPWGITEDVSNTSPITDRFAIRESHGGGPG